MKQLLSGIGEVASQTPPQNLVWKTEDLKYLGVSLGNKAIVNKNWCGRCGGKDRGKKVEVVITTNAL